MSTPPRRPLFDSTLEALLLRACDQRTRPPDLVLLPKVHAGEMTR